MKWPLSIRDTRLGIKKLSALYPATATVTDSSADAIRPPFIAVWKTGILPSQSFHTVQHLPSALTRNRMTRPSREVQYPRHVRLWSDLFPQLARRSHYAVIRLKPKDPSGKEWTWSITCFHPHKSRQVSPMASDFLSTHSKYEIARFWVSNCKRFLAGFRLW